MDPKKNCFSEQHSRHWTSDSRLVKLLLIFSAITKMPITESFLSDDVPSMGIYETLYAFRDSWGAFMGTEGTHPWSQGFPLTTQLKDG